ncbi:E3 ubiquitin-protein ligase bre1 [Microbotryomycetes sp. JL221]|nr:E3 ubiquitin-protein ligase bre1 [Microbotryomycetes sp. JL221]
MNGVDDQTASRKRDGNKLSLTDVDKAVHKKPRIDTQTQPQHGHDDDNHDDDDDHDAPDVALENFRKEAIWREMQEFKRKLERAQHTVQQLEQDKIAYEARLSAVDIVWNQLVNEADMLLPTSSAATNGLVSAALVPTVSDPSFNVEQLSEALTKRTEATRDLLSKLQSLQSNSNPHSSSTTTTTADLETKCRTLLQQTQTSQESLRILKIQHDNLVKQLETTVEQLVRAEKRLDRFKSKTLNKVEANLLTRQSSSQQQQQQQQQQQRDHVDSPRPITPRAETGGSDQLKLEEGEVAPSPTTMTTFAQDHNNELTTTNNEQLTELQTLLDARTLELQQLRQDQLNLKKEFQHLQFKLKELPDDVVRDSVPCRVLSSHVQHLMSEMELKRTELERLSKEADGFREQQETFRVKTMKEAKDQLDEMQKRLNLKEADLSRIRAQREDLKTETTQLRSKDWDKMKFVEALKTLNTSQTERLKAYSSQVKRLRMQVAAAEGDLTMVETFSQTDEQDLVNDLRQRLKTAEELMLAVRDQLTNYIKGGGPSAESLAKSEEQARLELSETKSKLLKFQKLFNCSDNDNDDATNVELSDVVKRLQQSEDKVKVMEAQLKSGAEASNMLYSEIERLSLAWSTLEEQNSTQVWNLTHTEEKIQKLTIEKTKADNKYFAAMREKEALSAENVVLTKLAEKQQKAITSANDLQDSLRQQLLAAEKEITLHQQNVRAHQDYIAQIKRDKAELVLRVEQHTKAINDMKQILNDKINQTENEIVNRKKSEEQVLKLERELKSAKSVAATMSNLSSSGGGTISGGSAETKQLRDYNADLQVRSTNHHASS